jgi:hypothetical protein
MYGELADWWPLLSSPDDYEEEAADYVAALHDHAEIPVRTLLELGSGGGNNASHMKAAFERLTLLDRSPGMLAVSRALNPGCEHIVGDMRTARVDRLFDAVFVHDAICYATSPDELRAVVETAWAHCRPGGAALLAPDYVHETFRPLTGHGGHDAPDGRGLRYLEWAWDPDPSDATYVVDYAFLLRQADGSTSVRYDRHLEGLFPAAEWWSALEDSGFMPHELTYRHAEHVPESRVFVGVKPP